MALITKSVNVVVDNVLSRFLASQDKVTDISPGSILRTLVEAIAFEIGTSPTGFLGLSLYDQLISVYNCGFLELSEGICLDRVVAILGVTRIGAVSSGSTVTFRRNTPAVIDILISQGSRVSTEGQVDQAAIVFETTADATFPTEILNERHTFSISATPEASDLQYDFDEKHIYSITEIRGVYNSVDVIFTQGFLMHLPPELEWVIETLPEKARRLIVTNEGERRSSFHAWSHDYQGIIEGTHAWEQVEMHSDERFPPLPATTVKRVFTRKD